MKSKTYSDNSDDEEKISTGNELFNTFPKSILSIWQPHASLHHSWSNDFKHIRLDHSNVSMGNVLDIYHFDYNRFSYRHWIHPHPTIRGKALL